MIMLNNKAFEILKLTTLLLLLLLLLLTHEILPFVQYKL